MSNRLSALGAAVTNEVQARSRRAFLVALGSGLLATFALGASVLPIDITANPAVGYGVFLAVFAATLAAMLYRQFGGDVGDALAVAGWVRLEAEDHWRKIGAGRIPRSPAEAAAWLVQHPDPTTLQSQRVSVQLLAGDLTAARATLGISPQETPHQRLDAASDRWFIAFMEGELPSFDELEAAATEFTDGHDRLFATVGLATLRAHAALAEGGDWVAPVAAVRPELGDAASGIIGARYILPTWTFLVAISALLAGGLLLFSRLTGVWR